MSELLFATELQGGSDAGCSWETLIAGIREYARALSPEQAIEINEWADLLEGLAQLES
jgi:hypothetical protein